MKWKSVAKMKKGTLLIVASDSHLSVLRRLTKAVTVIVSIPSTGQY